MHGRTIYINDQNAVGDIMFKKKPIKANSARDGSSCEAGHPKLVLDLAVERLLKRDLVRLGKKNIRSASRWQNGKWSHRQNCGFLVEVEGVHDDEDLLVLVSESTGLLEGSLAVVLHPAVLAQEGGGKPDGQTCNWQWCVGNGQWA